MRVSFSNELIAQTTTSGGLTGVVTDPTHAVVLGAEIEIDNQSIQRLRKCTIIAFVQAAECKHTKNCYSPIALPIVGVEHPSFYIAERGARDSNAVPCRSRSPVPAHKPSDKPRMRTPNHIPHNLQESLRTSAKSSLLNPVRFAQLPHDPTSGTRVSLCLSNGADASRSGMFDSIHAASSRTGIRICVLPSLVHRLRKDAAKASCCCDAGSLAINRAWPMVILFFQKRLGHRRN
jgi:hypothetical protein